MIMKTAAVVCSPLLKTLNNEAQITANTEV